MSFARLPFVALLLLAAMLTVLPCDLSAAARVEVRLIDTVAIPQDTGYIGVYLTNRLDTVAAFEITLRVDRPDLIGFLPSYDSTGTLTSGWEYLSAQVVANGIKLAGIADLISPTHIVKGIPPSPASRLLVRFPYFARLVPDSLSARTATITFLTDVKDLGIASSFGQLIGILQDTIFDTLCYRCSLMVAGVCQGYVPSSPPCDSSAIVISDVITTLDTSQIHLLAGSVTLLPDCHPIPNPGDVDANGIVDSADLSFLRYYVQYGVANLPAGQNADLNRDSCINWTDAEILDRYLIYGTDSITFPSCGIRASVRCCCQGRRGNLNNDRYNVTDLQDLAMLVSFLTGGYNPLPCSEGADCDGNGRVELADLSRLVLFLTTGTQTPVSCP
jgi:hypothetical protein